MVITGGRAFSVGGAMAGSPSAPNTNTAKQPTLLINGIDIKICKFCQQIGGGIQNSWDIHNFCQVYEMEKYCMNILTKNKYYVRTF